MGGGARPPRSALGARLSCSRALLLGIDRFSSDVHHHRDPWQFLPSLAWSLSLPLLVQLAHVGHTSVWSVFQGRPALPGLVAGRVTSLPASPPISTSAVFASSNGHVHPPPPLAFPLGRISLKGEIESIKRKSSERVAKGKEVVGPPRKWSTAEKLVVFIFFSFGGVRLIGSFVPAAPSLASLQPLDHLS